MAQLHGLDFLEEIAALSVTAKPLLMQIASQVGQVVDKGLVAMVSSTEEAVPLQVDGWELSPEGSHGCKFQRQVESELRSKLQDFRQACPAGLLFLSLSPDASRVGGVGIQACPMAMPSNIAIAVPQLAFFA